MTQHIIMSANAPSPPLYSQGGKAGPHVLVSGIVGIDPVPAASPETRAQIRRRRH
jgi:enamine deaminase RidA (YjgF/YER057c/UK114 family)